MRVLGIETSCDETGVAIYDSGSEESKENTESGIIADVLHSQIELHAQYGGVVPELASRDHVRKIIPLIHEALEQASLSAQDIDGIAYTKGPGLLGALLVGSSVGRSLAYAWDIPAIGVHHMEGHLLAPMLEKNPPVFPFVALLVSGGHTQLISVTGIGEYQLLGESIDDAAGEAFDKTAKMMGLSYPGGPILAKLAESGSVGRFKLPRPMTDRPGLDFSFSGLKTAALTTWKKSDQTPQTQADLAYAFEEAVVETIAIKCRRALEQTQMKTLVIAGGVSANTHLRRRLTELVKSYDAKVYYPRPEFCTDNGAMIAYAGSQRLLAGQQQDLDFSATARWPIHTLESLRN